MLGALTVLGYASEAAPLKRDIPRTLPSHPGNIFLVGENVIVAEPPGEVDTWRVVNYENKTIRSGAFKDGKADVGLLPVGIYKIVRGEGHITNRVFAAVLEPLKAPTPTTSPIGIDVAMAWIYSGKQMTNVINICQLAGMNWVRDRMSWPELEGKRGMFAPHTRYDDSLDAQSAAGLRILQVNHASPSWANTNSQRFPLDLRDAYNTYRQLAKRWHGKIDAFEPWNEADIKEFGGHTGSEMATFQKACYLGMKAGDPDLPVCQNVFAIQRASTLADFNDNHAWPYYDIFNLHHYKPFTEYPKLYHEMRAISGGKPMWVSECNVTVQWHGDEKLKEPTDADLREQSERVAKVYTMSMYEGTRAVFYFMLPDYTERQIQYGILHKDLTPRPAFVAAAAVGRLLADAVPLGRLKLRDELIHGFVFRAKPDGKEADVLVIWADSNETFQLTKEPRACFDHLGRQLKNSTTLALSSAPTYVILADDSHPELFEPPTNPPLLDGKPSPVIIQAFPPEKDVVMNESAYRLHQGREATMPLFIYNFGAKPVRGKLDVSVPEKWKAQPLPEVEVAPGDRKELTLHLKHPEKLQDKEAKIRVAGHFGTAGTAVLAFRFTTLKD
jgi:hypothetical protein